MFNVILLDKYNEDTYKIYEKNKEPHLISINDIFSSKITNKKNTIIFHNINMEDNDISGINIIMDNTDFEINSEYNRSIFIPIFNIFNGLISKELLYILGINENESNVNECINIIENVISNIDEDILIYMIRYKRFTGFLKFKDLDNKELQSFLKKQLEERTRYFRRNSPQEILFSLNYILLDDFLTNEGFVEPIEITKSIIEGKEITNQEESKDLLKKLAVMTKYYEGYIITENIEVVDENMIFLEYPNIYERNQEEVIIPFSILRYFFLQFKNIKVKEVFISERKYLYTKFLNKKFENEKENIISSMINFKINYDNMNIINQLYLQGYTSVFLFSTINEDEDFSNNLKLTSFNFKYCKGSLNINKKELLEDFDNIMLKNSLISIN